MSQEFLKRFPVLGIAMIIENYQKILLCLQSPKSFPTSYGGLHQVWEDEGEGAGKCSGEGYGS